MRSPKYWFTITPEPFSDDDAWWEERERREKRWFNRCYEHSGTRVRFLAGDLQTGAEREHGGRAGVDFEVSINLCQEDIPEFYLPDNKNAKYDIHTLSIIVWRWGIYLSIRGKVDQREGRQWLR